MDLAVRTKSHGAGPTEERFALVWIDGERATILRWHGRVVAEKLVSDVPPHVRSTGHVRHDPTVRHGGSGRGQDDAEGRRNEHLRAFLHAVADRLGQDDRIEILGTGTVGEQLAALLRRQTARRHSPLSVEAFRSMPLTPRQLASRLRQRLGMGRRRQTVGAYRWSGKLPRTRSGAVRGPRRVVDKELRPDAADTEQG
jgi:glycosyltransferase involved in cell wall biosynthesis